MLVVSLPLHNFVSAASVLIVSKMGLWFSKTPVHAGCLLCRRNITDMHRPMRCSLMLVLEKHLKMQSLLCLLLDSFSHCGDLWCLNNANLLVFTNAEYHSVFHIWQNFSSHIIVKLNAMYAINYTEMYAHMSSKIYIQLHLAHDLKKVACSPLLFMYKCK